jgi:hypothetical protein
MKNKLPAIAVFIFILIVMYFLFPRGCDSAGATPQSAAAHSEFENRNPSKMKGRPWI